MSVLYRAPLRIDLAGGTLDIWPLYLQLANPVTVNLAITRYAEVVVRPGPSQQSSSLVRRLATALGDPGFETDVQCPRGSGLGGSSALAVTLIRALLESRGERPSKARIFQLARDLEAMEIRTPTGDQDYLASLHGGLNVIAYGPGGPRVDRIEDRVGRAVMDRIVLFYTGVPHFSGINNWQVFRSVFDGDRAVKRRLDNIGAVAAELAAALKEESLDAAGRLIGREWRYRRKLADGITTGTIERAFAAGKKKGALSGKVCGAGGGGCAFLWCREGQADRVARAVSDEGLQLLSAKLSVRGLSRRSGYRSP